MGSNASPGPLDREASWRQDKRLATRLRVAKLRQQAVRLDRGSTYTKSR